MAYDTRLIFDVAVSNAFVKLKVYSVYCQQIKSWTLFSSNETWFILWYPVLHKFKIEKPQHVLHRRGPRDLEAEQSSISLPLQLRNWRKRGLKFFSLSRRCGFFEKKLLKAVWRRILSKTRWSSMLAAKATGTLTSLRALCWKRKKLTEHFQIVAEILWAEFKPV